MWEGDRGDPVPYPIVVRPAMSGKLCKLLARFGVAAAVQVVYRLG